MTLHAVPHSQMTPSRIPIYSAEDLTNGGTVAQIVLGDQTYTLRVTRAGKLILTK